MKQSLCQYLVLSLFYVAYWTSLSDQISIVKIRTEIAVQYLEKYGFLENDIEVFDRAESQIASLAYREALKLFQKRYRLPVTGTLNLATRKLMTMPRCGNPDIRRSESDFRPRITITDSETNQALRNRTRSLKRSKRYFIFDEANNKWSKRLLSWQIRSYPTKHLTRGQTHAVFQHAFNMWSRVIDIDFEEQKDFYKAADIIIEFGSGYHGDSMPFDGESGVLAHTFYPTPDDVYTFSGDAHFDDDENWHNGPHEEYRNLVSVATHELGHSMGLGHSEFPAAIMFPYYLSTWRRIELHPDDIKGMQKLYGTAKPNKSLPPEPVLPDIDIPVILTTEAPETEEGLNKKFSFCNVTVDAIIKLRNLEHYVFTGNHVWRMTWSRTVTTWISYQIRDGPSEITYYWPALPKYVSYIDGGVEREDGHIYIFRETRFWLLFHTIELMQNFPKDGLPLTVLGLPKNLAKIDTIFRWGENNAIYIFANDRYWKLREKEGRYGTVESTPSYPRLIANTWIGIPTPVQAAFTQMNGETLFLKDNQYWEFDNIAMKIRPGFPKIANLTILGCFDVAIKPN